MSRSYLIDGYNLLHALGLPPGKLGPQGLDRARKELIGTIAAALGERASSATIVFDAYRAHNVKPEQVHEGVNLLFAIKHEEADDLIEELIRQHTSPRHLTVVSNDHRVQRAGKRRRCEVLECSQFLDVLDRERKAQPPAVAVPPEKEIRMTEAERQHWLNEFAELDNDPAMKELFDAFGTDDFRDF